jgi:LuxR family transcriptional regulator, regulator of acetate metabolism
LGSGRLASVAGAGADQTALAEAIADLTAMLDAELAGAQPSRTARLCASLLELSQLSLALQSQRVARQSDGVKQVRKALARLRGFDNPTAMLRAATSELCATCGFDRAMLTRLEGAEVVIESVHIPRDPELAARVLRFGETTRPHLDHLLIETDMIRRGAPILVADATTEPRTHPALVRLLDTRAYVAAPIMLEGRVVGFLHADLYDSDRYPDDVDRDRLWALAEGFGHAIERATLLERLRADRAQMRSLWHSAQAVLADADADIELVAHAECTAAPAPETTNSSPTTPASPIDDALTKRERGVLALMIQGATNAAIGEKLVISQGTVKSHVANILRKLGASNRADAVARYLQATRAHA